MEVTPIILCLVGIVLCLCGYKIQKVVITLTWFLIGFNLSVLILPNVITDDTTALISSLIIGVICGALGFKLEKLALFITVAYLTYLFLKRILVFDEYYMNLLIRGGISLLLGAVSVLLIRPILIIASTLGGVSLIYENLPSLITIDNNVAIIICIIIIIISLIYQFKTT